MTKSHRTANFDSEVQLVRGPMKIFGLWPYAKYQNCIFSFVLSILITSAALSTQVFTKWNPKHVVQYVLSLLLIFLIIQVIIFKWNEEKFGDILGWMEDDWRRWKYMSYEKQRIVFEYMKKTRKIVKCWMISCLVLSVTIFLLMSIKVFLLNERHLPFYIWYSKSALESPDYQVLFIIQMLLVLFLGIGWAAQESCIIIMNLHCCAQMAILAHTIRHAAPAKSHHSDNCDNCSCIRCIINRHLEIIQFNKLCRQFCDIWLTPNTVIGFIGAFTTMATFVSLEQDEIILRVASILFLLILFTVGTILCVTGEFVISGSNNIGNASYESAWYDSDKSLRAQLLIILTFVNGRPIKMSFGNMFTLSVTIIKEWCFRQWSAYSLFKSINER